MSTETIDRATNTDLDYPPEGGDLAEPPTRQTRHTQPSQQEIAAAVSLSEVMLGASKNGSACYDAWHVEDGIAFRPRGSNDESEYRWQRQGDFLRENDLLGYADTHLMTSGMAAMESLALLGSYNRTINRLRESLYKGYGCLGKNGRRKFKQGVDQRLGRMLDSVIEE